MSDTTMFDANGKELYRGSQVTFWSSRTRAQMDASVVSTNALGQMIEVQIEGDPFTVNVPMKRLTKRGDAMPTETKERPSRKDMRRLASKLGVDGWEALGTDDLWAAILEAEGAGSNGSAKPKKKGKKNKAKRQASDEEAVKKGKTKEEVAVTPKPKKNKTKAAAAKAPARSNKLAAKSVAKKDDKPAKDVAANGNPFRPGTNLWLITEELVKGGKRAAIIARLLKKIDLHPWAKKPKDLDLNFEMDKRVLLAAHMLKNKHGFSIVLEGRGPGEGTIKAFPPGVKGAVAKPKKAKAAGPKVKTKRTSKKAAPKKKAARKAA